MATITKTISVATSGAATATVPGTPGVIQTAAFNDTTSANKAVTPAGLAAFINNNSVGGTNYSTVEQDTGTKWLNGKKIFQITFSGTSFASGDTVIMPNVENVINQYGKAVFSDTGLMHPLPSDMLYHSDYLTFMYYNSGGNLRRRIANRSGTAFTCTVFYTKVTE